MNRIIECVPNYSEGRNLDKVERIVDCFRGRKGVKLLDYSSDPDHNRSVVTLIGEPEYIVDAVVESIGVAIEVIDLRVHEGQHPRMGAVDVIPFIPVQNSSMAEADLCAKETAKRASELYDLPIILYEVSATAKHRTNLASIRKGGFEAMSEKLKTKKWASDFGPETIHPSAGVTAVGARMPLIAYNIKLDTDDLSIADAIAKKIRYKNGGFRYCKAMGVELKDKGIVEVSMNLTDFSKTSMYMVFETVKMECRRYGVSVLGSEIIGLVPMQALIDSTQYYLGLLNFNMEQVLEKRIWTD